ncbi:MAG: response regulator [Lachnospiraceae bacterium]|nr:response regulator [Lachnospiraceae bacterium]
MSENHVMMLGEKESFLIRVLMKKLSEAEIQSEFVPLNVDSINAKWEGTSLITIYMDKNDRPFDKALTFLSDKISDSGIRVIPIGEDKEVQFLKARLPGELIYRSFIRPVDNDEYVRTVKEITEKVEAGEFKKTILIVDDDMNYLGLVREWLKGTYKVAMANSGLQAIKWLGKNKADLILLDHEMPVTSGPQVLEMLRSEEDTKDIPVMFLTGKSDKQSVMKVVALKPEGYFLKTIEKQELLDNLEKYFMIH